MSGPAAVLDLAQQWAKISAFINEQGCLAEEVTTSLPPLSTRRDELGIASLDIIVIIGSYLELRGLDASAFNPGWVARLDDVEGIMAIVRDIDAGATGAVVGT